jgi:hypothetical protein
MLQCSRNGGEIYTGRKFLHEEKILFTEEGSQKNPKPKYFSFFCKPPPSLCKRESKPEPHFSPGEEPLTGL